MQSAKLHLVFVRHGETECNKQCMCYGSRIDAPLNENGLRQAECVAERLAKELPKDRVHSVCSSELSRAAVTADVIYAALVKRDGAGVKRVRDKGLNELCFGNFEGRHLKTECAGLYEMVEKWDSGDLDYTTEEAERPSAGLARAREALGRIMESAVAAGAAGGAAPTVVVVAHYRILRILIGHILGESMRTVVLANTALYKIDWLGGEEFVAVLRNCAEHVKGNVLPVGFRYNEDAAAHK